MPFKSIAQMRKCFAMQRRNPKSTWDCRKWAAHTPNIKRLPKRKRG